MRFAISLILAMMAPTNIIAQDDFVACCTPNIPLRGRRNLLDFGGLFCIEVPEGDCVEEFGGVVSGPNCKEIGVCSATTVACCLSGAESDGGLDDLGSCIEVPDESYCYEVLGTPSGNSCKLARCPVADLVTCCFDEGCIECGNDVPRSICELSGGEVVRACPPVNCCYDELCGNCEENVDQLVCYDRQGFAVESCPSDEVPEGCEQATVEVPSYELYCVVVFDERVVTGRDLVAGLLARFGQDDCSQPLRLDSSTWRAVSARLLQETDEVGIDLRRKLQGQVGDAFLFRFAGSANIDLGVDIGAYLASVLLGGPGFSVLATGLTVQSTLAQAPGYTLGMEGDPHIKTWGGEYFDYMGQCDLVMLQVSNFADSHQNLTVHVRTTLRYGYSYIETAAVQIGEDVLEVSSWGEYAFNGVEGGALRKSHLPKLGGFDVVTSSVDARRKDFAIIFGQGSNMTLSNMKDIVSVRIHNPSGSSFSHVSGLLGDKSGRLLARDGVTDLTNDVNAMGQEWQVRDDEPMLFRAARAPQYPERCILPNVAEKEARRLGQGIGEEDAKVACAHLKDDASAFANCVYDVTATNDLDMAQIGGF